MDSVLEVCFETVNMDFSRLHTYTPPQCVPENTGYTYALSSSYSSDALDFETEHRLDPVFDSPRMSRRSLRLVTTARAAEDGPTGDRAARLAKQRSSAHKPAFSINHTSRKVLSLAVSQSGSSAMRAAACLRPPVLDESLIREQTKVDHFWGLDDDGELKGGNKAAIQGNGDVAAGAVEAAGSNGYTCSDCNLLSERKGALTAYSAARGPASRIYSRDRSQKRRAARCRDSILSLVTRTSASFPSFLVQLFQVALMKLNYESENYKLKSYESKDRESKSCESKSHESKAHSSHCGRMNMREPLGEDGHLRANGASLCDDCKGRKHLETRTATRSQPSRPGGLAGTVGLALSHAGHFSVQALREVGATGGFVSRTVSSVLWLALAAPGKAASEVFWWLGIGWYQFVTLVSWLNVFLLTRCLRNICKFLILLIPLLLLLGASISLWGQGDVLSLLPVLNWMHSHRAQGVDDPRTTLTPDTSHPNQPLQVGDEVFHWHRMSDVERQVAALSGRCHSHDRKLGELSTLLQKLQARVDRAHGRNEGVSPPVRSVTDYVTLRQEYELRISDLEDILGKLTERSEAIQKELEQTALRTVSRSDEEPRLLAVVQRLEQELGRLKADLSSWQHLKTSCEKVDATYERVDAQVRETLRLMFSGDEHESSLEWLLQKLSAQFVNKDNLQILLRDLELQILKNITHHISVTKQMPTSETVVSAVNGAGVSGITEAQARAIVNSALRLYSQDKTGMVDFALESGGGSILSTRCSETYETKTALISLFGVPLWYFSQSPRVAIQPDIYPGNCWAFKGSQGYLVVRLSMKIHPTTFTLEHIPKTLSPTGNITSAPKDFAVYGLENENQEEGQLLGQFTYDQEGESLQMFPAPKRPERAFQIVELRIFSNWGHPEYTCLYRFRVHGEPIK
ncbi:SUN domain-containing protein 1 isoform X1 [Eubalaena glacialis]|uniref:SUN domain-containing protein 1 isoform X1 n=2 Tax=Eubalaena glacialis TaxID=27606 RepID=UPI002A59D6C8|nr:SUN domain-containing protein 1 isoform X1 [Eubalaena glacialis]